VNISLLINIFISYQAAISTINLYPIGVSPLILPNKIAVPAEPVNNLFGALTETKPLTSDRQADASRELRAMRPTVLLCSCSGTAQPNHTQVENFNVFKVRLSFSFPNPTVCTDAHATHIEHRTPQPMCQLAVGASKQISLDCRLNH
jgi:hypothetical protein